LPHYNAVIGFLNTADYLINEHNNNNNNNIQKKSAGKREIH
jgi:hypothetical protein